MERRRPPTRYDVVVVGASWGGLNALSKLISGLPADFQMPVVLVQHRSKGSENLLARLLQDDTLLPVREVDDKDPILEGHVYVAPADYHLLVEDTYFSLTTDDAVRFSRPSIDVTFTSAADSHAARVIGVVLTGANDDGSRGLRRIIDRGGLAIVQDPDTAEVRTMPQAALAAAPTARVLDLNGIGAALTELDMGPASRGHTFRPTNENGMHV